jgi:hypothetical protein
MKMIRRDRWRWIQRPMVWAAATLILWPSLSEVCAADDADADKVTFADHVSAILRQRCASCHNTTDKASDLDVTNYTALMQGGAGGKVIDPGNSGGSRLIELVTHSKEPFMPPASDKLPDAEIEVLRRWVDGGALETMSSVSTVKKNAGVAGATISTARPEVIPLPGRLVLEPVTRTSRVSSVASIATSPWAPVAALTGQHQVLLYNSQSLDMIGVLPVPEAQPSVTRFSRNGQLLLVAAGRDAVAGKAILFDLVTGQRIAEVGDELDTVLAADISADHALVALGGPRRVVNVYATDSGQLAYQLTKHTEWITALEFSPDGVLLATADRNGGVLVWEAVTGREYLTLAGHGAAVTGMSWRADSNVLATTSEDGSIKLWELENGSQIRSWDAHPGGSLVVEYTRDGKLVSGGRDRVARLWDENGQALATLEAAPELVDCVSYCDETAHIIVSDWNGEIRVFQADGQRLAADWTTNPPTLAERLAAAQADVEAKTAALEPLAASLAALKTEADKAAAEVAAATTARDQAQVHLDRVAAELNAVSSEKTATDQRRAELDNLTAQHQQSRPLVEQALANLREAYAKAPANESLKASLAGVEAELTQIDGELAAWQTELQSLGAKIDESTKKMEAVDSSLAAARSAMTAATEALQKAESTRDAILPNLAAAEQGVAAAQEQLAAAQALEARWTDEIAFTQLMETLTAELAQAQQAVAARQSELEAASSRLAEAQSGVDAATAVVESANQEVAKIQEQMRAATARK